MKLKDAVILTTLLFGMTPPAFPQTAQDVNAWDQRRSAELRHLPGVVRAYANSIGCAVSLDPRNVVRWKGLPDIQYVALVSLDEGCAGGSHSWRSVLVGVREGAGGKLFVNTRYSIPGLTSDRFPQLIDSLQETEHGVRFVGRVPQGNDPQNLPTKRVIGDVEWSGEGWVARRGVL